MSNPNKGPLSFGAALGRGTGGALGAGAAAVVIASLGGPAGMLYGGIIGAAGGFTGGFVGYFLGYAWDDTEVEGFGSAALYTTVVSGTLATIFGFLAWDRMTAQMAAQPQLLTYGSFALSAFEGFVSSMSRSLIMDLRTSARY